MHSWRFCILYWSEYLFRILVQLCICGSCQTIGTAQYRALYYLCLNSNYSGQQRLQIEILNFNNICIVLVDILWKIQRGLLKYNWFSQKSPTLRTPTQPVNRLQRLRDALKIAIGQVRMP